MSKIQYLKRIIRLVIGLLFFSIGSFLTIQANVGLAPWECFSMGIAGKTSIMYGTVVMIVGFVVLGIDLLLKEKIGLGTILDILVVGKVIDLLTWINIIPMQHSFASGIAILLLGQFVLCIGSYFYIGSGFSCGPRDALMLALSKKLPKLPVGLIRGGIEGTVLLVGWLLGAKVGIGTVIAVFGIGFILQFTFKLMRFEVKSVKQEDIVMTVRNIFGVKE